MQAPISERGKTRGSNERETLRAVLNFFHDSTRFKTGLKLKSVPESSA
jgi:hypothetical protein